MSIVSIVSIVIIVSIVSIGSLHIKLLFVKKKKIVHFVYHGAVTVTVLRKIATRLFTPGTLKQLSK